MRRVASSAAIAIVSVALLVAHRCLARAVATGRAATQSPGHAGYLDVIVEVSAAARAAPEMSGRGRGACDCRWANTESCAKKDKGTCFKACCGGARTICPERGGCTCDCSWASNASCQSDDGGCCHGCCCGAVVPGVSPPVCLHKRPEDFYPIDRSNESHGSSLESIFCFALMIPATVEQELITMQYAEWASIFSCDGYAVYSNELLTVGDGLNTTVVNSSLKCKKGGEFNTALNNDIFFAVWDRVASDGQYLQYDWTVKVDPDTVFLPWRLRRILKDHTAGSGGVYLNNCKYGLHGPLEVFSREAVTIWLRGRSRCQGHFDKVCDGSCYWGEDIFIDQCLCTVLGVRRDSDYGLLKEDNCEQSLDWRSCDDRHRAAFHAFKNVESWKQCMKSANFFDPPPSTSTSTSTPTQATSTTSTTSSSSTTVSSTTLTSALTSTMTSAPQTLTWTVSVTQARWANEAAVAAAQKSATPNLTLTKPNHSAGNSSNATVPSDRGSNFTSNSSGNKSKGELLFHCDSALNNWLAAWSDAKKVWCCEHERKGCRERRSGVTNGSAPLLPPRAGTAPPAPAGPAPPAPAAQAPTAPAPTAPAASLPAPPAPSWRPQPEHRGCEFVCDCAMKTVNCEQYIFQVFQKAYSLMPNACMAAYNVVVDGCPCCLDGGCTAEAAGCVSGGGRRLELTP